VRQLPKLNAVDSISPAFNLTKTNLFNPFRWGFWVRIGILGFLTGEMSSGGGCNFNVPSNWNTQRHDSFATVASGPPFDPHILLAALPVIIGVILVLSLVFLYISSVCRFILLEAVINGRISIREGWSRWQSQGVRFFVFRLLFGLSFFVVIGAVALVILAMVGLSSFKQSGGPAGAAIAAILFGILIVFLLALPYIVVYVLAKDFAVPVMALEGATFGDAWRRVWAMVRNETGSVAGYLGMKFVLAIAAGVVFGIISFIVLLVILLPVGGMGVLAVFAGKAAGMTWNPLTITLIVAAATLLIALVIFVMSFVSAPVAVFFPAYGLYFFAGRYMPLHDRLFPPPPPAPPVPEAPPEPPPTPESPPEFLPT
jgi:hypothetical protein